MTWINQIIEAFNHLTNAITASPEFQAFGIVILFLWTIIPSFKSIVPEVFSFALLSSGISPVVLVLVSATGATIGDYLLYMLGRGSYRLFKGKNKEVAQADHLFRKYRLPIFLATPFLSIIGDIVVLSAGIERIGFSKMFPYLFTGQLIRMTIGMLALLGLIELPNFLGI